MFFRVKSMMPLAKVLFLVALVFVAPTCGLFLSKSKSGQSTYRSAIDIKNRIKYLAKNTDNGLRISETNKNEILSLVETLNKQNKVKQLTKSSLLNGDWELIFTTTKGSSAGKLGPFVGKVSQVIDVGSGEYSNIVKLNIIEGKLDASWNVLSNTIWEVRFINITFNLFGIQLFQKPLIAKGIWSMSYLDNDFRILTAKGGSNSKIDNLYILGK